LVVGFTAGGPTDIPARFLADRLSISLGKPVVVENKPGAGADPPPLKWSDLRYVFDIKEDCNGKEAIQA
jgi:hypothetical protein